jgi:hypothetical protein
MAKRVHRRTTDPWGRLFLLGLSALLLIALPACAGSGGGGSETRTVTILTGDGQQIEVRRTTEPPTDHRVALTADEAWSALPDVYHSLSLEADIRAPAQREIGVSQRRYRGQVLDRRATEFFNCGVEPGLNRPLADRARIDARIVTAVLENADGTASLRTRIQATAMPTGGTGGRAECRSTGLMERIIAELTRERAQEG